MKKLPLPARATDVIKLADWLEICALMAPDHNSSSGDIQSALRASGIMDPDDFEKIETLVRSVFGELEMRSIAAGNAYPFSIKGGVVQAARDWTKTPSYVFCLFISYFGWRQTIGAKVYPRRLFEDLSCHVAQQFTLGQAVRFASPRNHMPKSFKKAVTDLCLRCLKEGQGFKFGPSLDSKDDSVDVVAWRHFPDDLPGKIVLFGSCASGENWEQKIDELQPDAFCEEWMLEQPVSKIIKALFIPHRVDRLRWTKYSRRAGIIFDRCRMAYWADGHDMDSGNKSSVNFTTCREWSKAILRTKAVFSAA